MLMDEPKHQPILPVNVGVFHNGMDSLLFDRFKYLSKLGFPKIAHCFLFALTERCGIPRERTLLLFVGAFRLYCFLKDDIFMVISS